MDVPKCRSISSSRSKKGQPRPSARILPTVVVPTQLTPTRLTRNSGSSLRAAAARVCQQRAGQRLLAEFPTESASTGAARAAFAIFLVRMQLPGGHQCLIGDGVAGAPHTPDTHERPA